MTTCDWAMQDGPTLWGQTIQLRLLSKDYLPFLYSTWNNRQDAPFVGLTPELIFGPGAADPGWEELQNATATLLRIVTRAGAPVGIAGWGFGGVPGMMALTLAPQFWSLPLAREALQTLVTGLLAQTRIRHFSIGLNPYRTEIHAMCRELGFRPAGSKVRQNGNLWELWIFDRPSDKPLSPIRTLLFDWGGVMMRTLDDSYRREWERRLNLPYGGVDRAVFESDVWREAQLGRCDVETMWQSIGASLELNPELTARFRRDFWAGDRLNQDLLDAIARWRKAGLEIALLSNFNVELEAILDTMKVRNTFSPVIVSASEGLTKPAARLYWRAIDRLQTNPGQVLFVDDTMENVTGARCVGLAALRFQQNWQAVRDIERVLNESG